MTRPANHSIVMRNVAGVTPALDRQAAMMIQFAAG